MSRMLSQSNSEKGIFLRNRKRPRPESEPLPETPKMPRANPVEIAVKNPEEVIPLSKDDIVKILSKEMPIDKASVVENFMSLSNITNQKVPSIYSSYFFRKDIIKDFQKKLINLIPTDKLSGFPLSMYNLYNKDDILNNTTYRPDVIGTRSYEKNQGYTNETRENMKKFIDFLSKRICSSIGAEYAKSAVNRAIDLDLSKNNFDILVASTRVIEDVTLSIEQRLEGVVAFVIVEIGECKKYPSGASINLICTDTKKAISGTGSILMGAFLYTILSHPDNVQPSNAIQYPPGNSYLHVTSKKLSDGKVIENCTFGSDEPLIPIQQVAVLELADAYINAGGLCMYEKFGFSYDQTMFTDYKKKIFCFDDRVNLPMLIDFNNKPGYAGLSSDDKKQVVLDVIVGKNKSFPKSKICSVRGDYQTLLGYLKSIKLYVDNTENSSLAVFSPRTLEGSIIRQIKEMHQDQGVTRRSRSAAQQSPAKEGTIDEVIDYIENPPQPDDPIMKAKVDKIIRVLPKPSNAKIGGTMKKYNRNLKTRYTKRRS